MSFSIVLLLALVAPSVFAEGADQPLLVIPASSAIVVEVRYSGSHPNEDWYFYNPNSFPLYVATVFNTMRPTFGAVGVSSFQYQCKYAFEENWQTYTASNLDSVTGVCWGAIQLGKTVNFSYVTNYSTEADFLSAVANYTDPAPVAVLIDPSDSYEWCTGFSLTNSGASSIAGGWVGTNFYLATYTAGYNISNFQTSVNFALFDQTTNLYYSIIPLQGQDSDRIGPIFDTAADFFASAVVVLDDSPTPAPTPTPGENTFEVPNGYVAYLHLADPTSEITLTAHFNRPSQLTGIDGDGSAWPNSQTYRYGTYLPIEPTQYPVSGSSYIRWFKAAGNQNIFGQTLDGVAHLTGGSNLIEIYNPATQSFNLDNQQVYDNPTLYGSTNGGILSCVKYELTDNITAGGSITSGFTGGQPVPDPDENDGNGNFINPSTNPGGGTDPVSGNSLQDILNNFFSRFLSIFTEGHQAIRNLTQSASQFVSHLSELYSWLPAEVLAVLTSAIILAIIIGVLKVFL